MPTNYSATRAMFAGEWRLRVASGNGDNEVAVALANNLFGWDDDAPAVPEVVHLAAK